MSDVRSVSGGMELEAVREKALSCGTVLRYLEPAAEMRMLWRSCLDIGTGYIENISNTIRSYCIIIYYVFM